jgi:hypothetical protein
VGNSSQAKGAAQTAEERLDIARLQAEVPYGYSAAWWRHKAIELQEHLDAASREQAPHTDEHHLLLNLLAVIHRDGGHYVSMHGMDKACEDAESKVVEWISREQAAPTPEQIEDWVTEFYTTNGLLVGGHLLWRRVSELAAYILSRNTYGPVERGASAVPFPKPDLEFIAAKVHENWIASKVKQGVTSRKSESDEELMVPYDQLSEAAKGLDRESVAAVMQVVGSVLSPAATPICAKCKKPEKAREHSKLFGGPTHDFVAESPIPSEAALAMVKIGLHSYLSTACLHGKHELCRKVCKYCEAICSCTDCKHAAEAAQPSEAVSSTDPRFTCAKCGASVAESHRYNHGCNVEAVSSTAAPEEKK